MAGTPMMRRLAGERIALAVDVDAIGFVPNFGDFTLP